MIPAGAVYQPALVEGAIKVAIRRGLSEATADAFGQLVSLAATAINSASPSAIEMLIGPHDGQLTARLTAQLPTTEPDEITFAAFESLARANAHSLELDRRVPSIGFAFRGS